MSIKLKYADINSPKFNQALATLAKETGFATFKASYNVARIVRQVSKEINIARELHNKWANAFFEVDIEGNHIPDKSSPFQFKIIPEKQEEFAQKWQEFLSTDVTLESEPLTVIELGTVKLSPESIEALTPILSLS